jgi:uncharacterized membrane protein
LDRKLCTLLLGLLMFLQTLSPVVHCQEAEKVNSLSFSVYLDGYVFIEYSVAVDPKSPTVNVTILGQTMSDVLVVDGANLPLEYSRFDGGLSVSSLGVDEVKVSYFTQDLTQKDGRFWMLNVTSPANATIILPSEATIVGFNQVPNLIDSSNDKILLLMPAGEIGLTYVTGLVGTRDYAQVVLNEAEQVLSEVRNFGLNVSSAEATLQSAWNHFDNGSFAEAETLGNQAKNSALQINQTAADALVAQASALSEINRAESESRSSVLDEARSILEASRAAFAGGDYSLALSLALDSVSKAHGSRSLSEPVKADQFPVLEVSGIALVIVSALSSSFFVLRFRRKKSAIENAKKKKTVDTEKIFKRNNLRADEQEAVRILVENSGKVLEAELYSRLNLPRTTTWRLVRRLERMGVVEVDKNRRDNVVRLKK